MAADDYFYQVLRYVERNAQRTGLVDQAEAWRWGSLWRRSHGTTEQRGVLSPWPLPQPRHWTRLVNEPQHESEITAIRTCVARGQPYGNQAWVRTTAQQLGLQATLRPRGRPRKPDHGTEQS